MSLIVTTIFRAKFKQKFSKKADK